MSDIVGKTPYTSDSASDYGGDFYTSNPQEELEDNIEDQSLNGIESAWKTAFKTKTFSNKATTNTIFSTEIYGVLVWNLIETMSLHAQALLIGRNGFTQSIYDREDRRGGLYLLEGFFKWEPSSDFYLKFGNIQQDFLKAPLLITDRTFPSFLGKYSLNLFSESNVSLLFQAAIPDNASEFVRRETQIVRGVPLFLTSSAVFDFPNFLFKNSIRESITIYYYYNLSPAVAERSRVYGNTISRISSDSTFTHAYFGIHNNFSLQKKISDLWILELGTEFLHNFLAPDTYNEGGRLYSSLYHNYRDFMELKFTGELFVNQSDAAIAYYNSEIYGHNNRRGFLAKLESHFYRSGLTFGSSFVYSQPVNNPDKSPIGDSFSFSIFLMTNYISI